MPDLTALAEKDLVTLLVIALIGLFGVLAGFTLYVFAPLARGRSTDKDSNAKQLDGLLQVIRDNGLVSSQTVQVLRELSVNTLANKDALAAADTHMEALAARNAALIRETHESVKLMRTDILSALDKLPAELREELSPIASEIKTLNSMSEAISGKVAELQKAFLEALQRMASPANPVPVYISNAEQFTRFHFSRLPPTLAESAKVSPKGEKVESKP